VESFENKLARVLAERIELVDYDPSWPSLYEAEVARVAAFFLPGSILRVEHIGSTAVPGLAAKPIVDILVGVDDFGFVVNDVALRMEAAGYDYFLRPAFEDDGPRYPWFIGRDQSGRRISHIHVARVDDDSQWDRVLFRDRLRRHPDVAREYATLKHHLAARFSDDREAYTLAKTAFITRETAAAKRESRA
jgi:GrpB-like predicted nucleotidyltransferase (UPF0157 family)